MPDPGRQRHRVLVQGLAPARKPASSDPDSIPSVPFRIGHGYDIHKLQEGGKLVLGGVVVSEGMSPIAYSDGDVVIHAVVDAVLGAMAWGDIGELFQESDPQWKDAASRIFLQTVCDRLQQARHKVINVDITILAERPRIAPFKNQMIQTLREVLGAECIINIKAGTNEGCDAVGQGQAIAAYAVVLLTPAA